MEKEKNQAPLQKRSKATVFGDVLVFLSIILLFASCLLSILNNVQLGNSKDVISAKNINVLAFFSMEGDGFMAQVAYAVNRVMETNSESAIVLMAFLTVVSVLAFIQLIRVFILTIVAIVNFSKGNSIKLSQTALSVIKQTVNFTVALALFAMFTNGMFEGGYYSGYTAGKWLICACALLLITYLISIFIRYSTNKEKMDKGINGKKRFVGALFSALGGFAIRVALLFASIIYVIVFVANESISLVLDVIDGDKNVFGEVLGVILNVLIIVAVMVIYARSGSIMERSFNYLGEYGEVTERKYKNPKAYALGGFMPVFVWGVIGAICAYVLAQPALDIEWKGEYLLAFGVIAIIAFVSQIFVRIFAGKTGEKVKAIPTGLPMPTDTEKEEQPVEEPPAVEENQIEDDEDERWRCNNCSTLNPKNSNFCSNCGSKAVWYCHICGQANDRESHFCGSCGTVKK